jgi:phosphotransferase system enzyme I (PtsI)
VRLPAEPASFTDVDTELTAACQALATVVRQVEQRAANLSGQSGQIMDTQVMIAKDASLRQGIQDEINARKPAALAVQTAFDKHLAAFKALGGYMAERVADLANIRDLTLAALLGQDPPGVPDRDEPYVLVAQDLAPADTVTLQPDKVLAIVTEKGGPSSHTAILARLLGIPAVVNCPGATALPDGAHIVVDGDTGKVILEPDQALMSAIRREAQARQQQLAGYSGPGSTRDGHKVPLLLNVDDMAGISRDARVDAEGIGLLRTEFLFLDRTKPPTVTEQREAYRRVFAAFDGRPVTVRTLDAGADKPLSFANSNDEPNPALGIRGYRIGRHRPELVDEQLEAIGLATQDCGADTRVMGPMISTPAEAAEFASRARAAGIATVGVMIEVPAAAILADQILSEVDFVSIGTNDLTQYTYAADRMLGELGDLLDPWQPALLALIRMVASTGRRLSKSVSVCGEAASDPALAPVLVGLGVTSLSMSAPAVPAVRASLRNRALPECQALAEAMTS